MRELAVQAANGTNTNEDRAIIQTEIDQLTEEIQAISNRTEYNKMKILSGEGARIVEGRRVGATDVDKAISTLLTISDNIQPGQLNYSIVSVGMPASLTGVTAAADTATVIPGSFKINGVTITAEAGETVGNVQARIAQAYGYAGITMWRFPDDATGITYLATNLAGSSQTLTVTGDSAVLAQFGLVETPVPVRGTDAVLNPITLHDQNGAQIGSLGNGLNIRTDGNQVTIVGINGENIRFNIQVVLNTITHSYTFGDGTVIGAGPYEMEFEFKNYGPIKIQVGPSYNNNVSMHIPRISAETLGFIEFKGGRSYKMLNYVAEGGASRAIGKIDEAIAMVSHVRSRLGAFANRLEATVRSLDIASENTESSRSRILDTDMAREMTRYSQLNVMYQAGLAILGQANMRPQQILSLLQ
jgi:flagellin